MKKLLLLIPALLIAGCTTVVPVKRTFPDLPEELKITCPDLKEATKNTTELTKLLDVVVVNYSTYYECRVKIDAFIEWHKKQKETYDKAN